jgi:predicted Zn finger-like uncharacterized protein
MQTRCPGCQSQLRVPDEFLGKRVKCPKCGHIFQAGQSPPPVVEVVPVEEEEQQSSVPATLKKKKKKARKQLGFWERTVRDTSLFLLIPCGLCCQLPALILGIIGMVTFTDPDAQENAKILTICAGIGIAIVTVLNLIGMLLQQGH